MKSKWERGLSVPDRRKRVAELHAKGLANIVIARRLGIADTTVSQDLLSLGLRVAKKPPYRGPLTLHDLAKLDTIGLQALFLNGMTPGERGSMTGKTTAFTFAELSRDQLIAAILRQHETTAPEYPRASDAVSATAIPPVGVALAGAGADTGTSARPVPPDLGPGGATGDAARPEPMRAAS